MNFYQVDYHGLWLGGVAIVAAGSEAEAIELVKSHPATWQFENVSAKQIPVPAPCVIYNDNGDY